jgi:hypothetical protein
MALPSAHATVGYLVHRLDGRRTRLRGWPRAAVYMAIANLPDADFLLGFALGQPGAHHRGISHTVLAGVVFGSVAATVCHRWLGDRWWPAAVAFAAAYGSHLLVDALTIDARGPAGAQFLWPLSDAYLIAPFTIFHEILIDGRSRVGFVRSVVDWPTVVVLAREVAIAALVVCVARAVEAWLRRAPLRLPVLVPAAEPGEEDLA